MKFFIAGIIQGSKLGLGLHAQNYREEIKSALLAAFPDADVYDPFSGNQDSVRYDPETGRGVFLEHNRMCAEDVDVLVAYLPEASMGTAIEIWEAWKNGAVVIVISSMVTNWIVRFLCDAVYLDADAFCKALQSGEIARIIGERPPRAVKRSLDQPGDFPIMPHVE